MVQLRKVRVNDHSITGIYRFPKNIFICLSDEMILNRFICGFMKLVFLKVRNVCAEMSGEIFFLIKR